MIEYEKTCLLKYIPFKKDELPSKEVFDIYIDDNREHLDLRLRKNGDKYEITRKCPVNEGDSSHQIETTIKLSEKEFKSLSISEGRKVRKIRYTKEFNGYVGDFDIFLDDLYGLAMVDFEFETEKAKNEFVMPEYCLADVTQEDFIAGGMLAGKKYEEIEKDLNRFGFKKISFLI